jgi:predicted dithiol-disulfide oxidoreductase (DUF899 family)
MIPFGFANESPEYRKLRAELREAEIALRDQRERVAALRRSLPTDTQIETDYVFHEIPSTLTSADAPARDVRLSELFDRPDQPLILVHFMYGKAQTEPCPMCTSWADGYDGVVPHLAQRVNIAVVAAGDIAEFRSYAQGRGWRNLRLLSSGDSGFKTDLGTESADGAQQPAVSVLTRSADGTVRHFYTGGAYFGEEGFRGMDLLNPLWHFLDLAPGGRGEFVPSLRYGE